MYPLSMAGMDPHGGGVVRFTVRKPVVLLTRNLPDLQTALIREHNLLQSVPPLYAAHVSRLRAFTALMKGLLRPIRCFSRFFFRI